MVNLSLYRSVCGVMLIFCSSADAFAVTDSLVSIEFETKVAQQVVASANSYKTVGDLLSQVSSANRTDQAYLADLVKKWGQEPAPTFTVSGQKIFIHMQGDKTALELVSSLERVYSVNEIPIHWQTQVSLQERLLFLHRLFKSHKPRTIPEVLTLWIFGPKAWATEEPDLWTKYPGLEGRALLISAVTVALESRINPEARKILAEQAPGVGQLLNHLTGKYGPSARLEISCRPKYLTVNEREISTAPPFGNLITQCCESDESECTHLINSISNMEHGSGVAVVPATATSGASTSLGPGRR